MDKLLKIELECYTCPPIVSGGVPYFGRTEDFDGFFAARRIRDPDLDSKREEAIALYKQGKTDVKHGVDFYEYTLFEEVSVDKRIELKKDGENLIEFDNIWDCPYVLKNSGYTVEICWCSYPDKNGETFARIIKCCFNDLLMENDFRRDGEDQYRPINILMGQPEFFNIQKDGNIWTSRLFVPEKYFETKEEYLADMEKNITLSDIDLRCLCLEIVGDG